MPEPDAAGPPAAPCLRFTLRHDPVTRRWQADLQADSVLRHFDSLPALIAWLARLETPPPGGIR